MPSLRNKLVAQGKYTEVVDELIALVNKKWTQKRKKWAGKYELLIRRGGGIGHSELNGCRIVKRIGRSLLIEEDDIVVDLFFNGTLARYMEGMKNKLCK